jgi:hypothetical protein
MARVERFWSWDADRWANQARECDLMANQPPEDTSEHQEIRKRNAEEFRRVMHGKAAFARRQAALRLDLLEMAKKMHSPFVSLLTVMDSFDASKRVEFIDEMARE